MRNSTRREIPYSLEGRIGRTRVLEPAFGVKAPDIFDRARAVTIVACGTSYYAASIARYWIEELVGIPCQVEIASEFRYRKVAVLPDSLFVTISQSGETADTLARLLYVTGSVEEAIALERRAAEEAEGAGSENYLAVASRMEAGERLDDRLR